MTAGLTGLAVISILALVGLQVWLWIENRAYARAYFRDLLPSYSVLESRKWHPLLGGGWDCTYAIAELPPDAAAQPPARSGPVGGWQLAWGGPWQPTPAPALGDTTRDALSFCSRYWPDGVTDRLQRALAEPGSYFERDGVGETLLIWSPPQRIAARVRYGD